MSSILLIGYWGVLVISVVLGITESLMFGVSLKKMGESGGMRKSLIFIFFSSVFCITYSIAAAILSILGISITENVWAIIPLLFLILSIFFVIFSFKLEDAIRNISQQQQ